MQDERTGHQEDEDRRGQLHQQGGGPEPDVRPRPGDAEQEAGRTPGVVGGEKFQTLHVGLRQDQPGVHEDPGSRAMYTAHTRTQATSTTAGG